MQDIKLKKKLIDIGCH